MKRFHLMLMGRFGNQMFSYAFARGYCERHGLQLCTDEWVGEKLFDLSHPRCTDDLPRRDEFSLIDGEGDISYRSYSQQQKCADYYTRAQCKRWFTPRIEVSRHIAHYPIEPVLAHYRADDFAPLGYVVVSKASFLRAAEKFGIDPRRVKFVQQESPHVDPFFAGWADFAPDFFRMVNAKVLFRSNSSFSWWAAVLSDARVFAPVIDGLDGGKEQDCDFLETNAPKLANLSFVTDIEIK